MNPSDLNLPAKFTSFRPGQLDSAMDLATSDARFRLLSAPTGTGKSLIYLTAAQLLSARTLILVGTKGLQEQLCSDFRVMGMADIRGQGNYPCSAVKTGGELSHFALSGPQGCDTGPCRIGLHCSMKPKDDPNYEYQDGCHYYDAQTAAGLSPIVVSNYAYWMAIGRFSDPHAIGKFDLIILDEAHTAPDWLTGFCAVELRQREIKKLFGLGLPPLDEGVAVWADWASHALGLCETLYTSLREDLLRGGNRQSLTKQLFRISRIGRDLRALSLARTWKRTDAPNKDARMPGLQTDWIGEETKWGARFSPVWAHAYAEPYLFRGIENVILTSATLSKDVARYLGIPEDQYHYYDSHEGFPAKRRPLIYIPTTRVDFRMVEGQKRQWISRIDQIIDGRRDRKGIIHSRSYARAQEIKQRSRHGSIMMVHSSRTRQETVDRFKRSKAPAILVSPSVEEGFDFPHDECRYQIIAKVPFVDGRSPVTKARSKADKRYLNYVAGLTIVQQVGRSTRAGDDWSETLIIDDHWRWFKSKPNFPKWFTRAWKTKRQVPPALEMGDRI